MIYNLLRSKCLHVCLQIDWNPYSTFKFTYFKFAYIHIYIYIYMSKLQMSFVCKLCVHGYKHKWSCNLTLKVLVATIDALGTLLSRIITAQ